MSAPASRHRLAVDIGGTFTDLVLDLGGGQRTAKVLTSYPDPAQAVLDGVDQLLAEAGITHRDLDLVLHGTTLATNAIIERRGARTALLTTAGHRDVLAMAWENRYEQYDIQIERPQPLVPRHLRLEVSERMDCHGRPLLPLDEDSVLALLPVLRAEAVESVAIGFLHAWANPAHERRVAEILSREMPGLALTQAAELSPEIREYERFCTACANAYVQPLMAGYLQRLETALRQRGLRGPLLLMTSGGGLTSVATACRFPIRLVESGPAGGAILAAGLARQAGLSQVLALDMGGTTAKLSLLDGGTARRSREFEVDRVYRFRRGSGLPLRIPVIEMVEIGAGGGSIGAVDSLGRLQAGPRSAGSDPGPAAYGRGGSEPTVTDADLLLGRIPVDYFAGGRVRPDRAAAERAVAARLATALQLETDDAAWALGAVVDENMALAARAHGAENGVDLAARSLIAIGGAAPLHAAGVAARLGISRIIVPAHAGVGSALGFLQAPVAYAVARSLPMVLDALDSSALNPLYADMRDEAEAIVRDAAPGADLCETRGAYMRYQGQGHELLIELPPDPFGPASAQQLRALFENAYAALYGRCIEAVPIEVLSWTLDLAVLSAAPGPLPEVAEHAAPEPVARQSVRLDEGRIEVPVYERAQLPPGCRIDGPVLIAEHQTTTVVPAGYGVRVIGGGHLELRRGEP